jgi:hypothetical protein
MDLRISGVSPRCCPLLLISSMMSFNDTLDRVASRKHLTADIQAVGVDYQQTARDDPRLAVNYHRFVAFQLEPMARVAAQNLALLVLELYNC